MSTRKTYFYCGLWLLLLAVSLFLVGGLGAKRQVIQASERQFIVVASSLLVALNVVPLLACCSLACGGLGGIQRWVAFPEALKRVLAYLFAAGIVLQGLAGLIRGISVRIDFEEANYHEGWWIGLWGFVLIALVVVFQLYGIARRRSAPQREASGGNMRAAKFYAVGGLLLILWVLMRAFLAFWGGWPWQVPRVVGESGALAGLFTWPLGAALGAAALFLSVLQPQIRVHERIKMAAGIVYFFGIFFMLSGLSFDLLREVPFDKPISWDTGVGVALVVAVLLVNLVGLFRHVSPVQEWNAPE